MGGPLAILQACADLCGRANSSAEVSRQYLRENGLAMARLGDPDPLRDGCGLLVVTPIRRVGKTRFALAEKGERGIPAAVVEVFGRDGASVIDLAAWPLARPTELRTMFGAASMLGISNVFNAWTYAMGKPLQVSRTALGWLRGGARGAVVLNPSEAARDLLDAPGRIAGEDHHHAVALAGLVASLFDSSKFVAPSRSEKEAA